MTELIIASIILFSFLVYRIYKIIIKNNNTTKYHAQFDYLTNLYNRRMFEKILSKLYLDAKKNNKHHYLFYIDLDKFKAVNDSCGHTAGDLLLKQVAQLFKKCLRSDDTVARLGGDEFAIIIKNCNLVIAAKLAKKVLKAINNYNFVWDGKIFHISASIGISTIDPKYADDFTKIMIAADNACYIAKNAGGNSIHISPNKDDLIIKAQQENTEKISEISTMIEKGDVDLFAQKIYPLNNKNFRSFEILVRGNKKDSIPTAVLIPLAEKYNLMPHIDRLVIMKVFANYDKINNINFLIKLSGQTVADPQLVKFISDQLKRFKVPPEKIIFEITENVILSNSTVCIKFINAIRDLGCKFALDDFGKGMSSLTYLRTLPVDILKIDGSFIKDINDPITYAIIKHINDIAHMLNIITVAEFVEDSDTIIKLEQIGVDSIQGFYLGKPELIKNMPS